MCIRVRYSFANSIKFAFLCTIYISSRVFEKRVLRRTFGPKRDEETGYW
jgi:hypothetical protein